MIYTSNCILSKVVSSTKRKSPLPLFRAHRSIPSILKARIKRERTYPSSLNPPSLTLFPFSLPTYPRSPPQHPNKDTKKIVWLIPRFLKKIPPFFLSLGISRPPLLLELHPGYFKFARTECIPSPDSVCNHFTLRPSSELRCALADAFGCRWRCIRRRHFSVRVTGDLGTSGLWRDVASNGGVEWDAELHVGCPGFFTLFHLRRCYSSSSFSSSPYFCLSKNSRFFRARLGRSSEFR